SIKLDEFAFFGFSLERLPKHDSSHAVSKPLYRLAMIRCPTNHTIDSI
ncbi:MAG: hypothetical protein ACI814_004643, partial [Mariniblastus sp.]